MEKVLLLPVCLIIFSIGSPDAQAQFRDGHQTVKNDTTSGIPVEHWLSSPFTLLPNNYTANISTGTKPVRLSKTAKLLLRIGTDFIRGEKEDNSMYSFKNAWKYPGRTVKYPETATEYELFLERYQRYASDN